MTPNESADTITQNIITQNIFHHALVSNYFWFAHMNQMSELVRRFESLRIHDIHIHDNPHTLIERHDTDQFLSVFSQF